MKHASCERYMAIQSRQTQATGVVVQERRAYAACSASLVLVGAKRAAILCLRAATGQVVDCGNASRCQFTEWVIERPGHGRHFEPDLPASGGVAEQSVRNPRSVSVRAIKRLGDHGGRQHISCVLAVSRATFTFVDGLDQVLLCCPLICRSLQHFPARAVSLAPEVEGERARTDTQVLQLEVR